MEGKSLREDRKQKLKESKKGLLEEVKITDGLIKELRKRNIITDDVSIILYCNISNNNNNTVLLYTGFIVLYFCYSLQ